MGSVLFNLAKNYLAKMNKININECWKAVLGYEGKYEVSDLGRVRSLNYLHTGKIKVLKPRDNRGYLRVQLFKDGKMKNFSVHTLVFWNFNGPIPPEMTVDHINGDKRDNRPENLQLLTREDNTRKSHKGKTPWNKGKKCKLHSEETKLRMSAAQKARWSGIKSH